MTFGLRNAGQTFQRYIHRALCDLDFAFAYINDILIVSSSDEEHEDHLRTFLQRLKEFSLKMNLEKYNGLLNLRKSFHKVKNDLRHATLEQSFEGSWKPLAFFTRKFTSAQTRYSAYDRELTAVYEAIKYFRHFLEGRVFKIVTDHKPLGYTFGQKSEKASPCQQRQLLFISKFSTDIEFLPGISNVVADPLLRIESIRLAIDISLMTRN